MATPNPRQINFLEPAMRRIPEDWFSMGFAGGRDDEKPVHQVWVDAFELAAYQTTNEDYARFLDTTRHPRPLHWDDPNFKHPKQPVVAASWFDAVAYCEWMSRISGRNYRLPSEAEWERAARGGTDDLLYPWGNWNPQDLPNYSIC